MYQQNHINLDTMKKLYQDKCSQLEKAKLANNSLLCMVLKAEAEALLSGMGQASES